MPTGLRQRWPPFAAYGDDLEQGHYTVLDATDEHSLQDYRVHEQDGAKVLTAKVILTKPQVLPYFIDGEVVQVLLPPDEYLNVKYLQTVPGSPVTDEHPAEGFVSDATRAMYSKGVHHSDVRIENGAVAATVTVIDEALIKQIESGEKRHVSIGRSLELVRERGTFDGKEYEFRHKNPVHNHTAFVRQGRCGTTCQIQLGDVKPSPSGAAIDGQRNLLTKEDKHMNKELFILNAADSRVEIPLCEKVTKESLTKLQGSIDEALGKRRDAENALADLQKKFTDASEANKQLQTRLDALKDVEGAKAKIDEIEKQQKELQAEKDRIQAQKDSLEAMIKPLNEKIEKLEKQNPVKDVALFMDVVESVRPVLGQDYDWRSKDLRAIKIDLIAHMQDKKAEDFAKHSNDYIDAAFDVFQQQIAQQAKKPLGQFTVKTVQHVGNDAKLAEKRKARMSMYQSDAVPAGKSE